MVQYMFWVCQRFTASGSEATASTNDQDLGEELGIFRLLQQSGHRPFHPAADDEFKSHGIHSDMPAADLADILLQSVQHRSFPR